MADKNPAFDAFKKALIENGAEFSDSFMTNLLRIIQHMKPVSNTVQKNDSESNNQNTLVNKFPGLAIPNKKPIFSSDDESDDNKEDEKKRITAKEIFKEEKIKTTSDNIVDQAMAELEALAPSHSGPSKTEIKIDKKEEKKRDRSNSRDRKDSRTKRRESPKDRKSRRSRSRDKRSRSRDKRSRSRDKRSRSRDRDKRRRSRSRHRHRSRSRDRRRSRDRHRSRSRGRRSKSRGKKSARSKDREVKYEYGKRERKRSPEVEMSDDPEPGKVSGNILSFTKHVSRLKSTLMLRGEFVLFFNLHIHLLNAFHPSGPVYTYRQARLP